MDRRSSAPCAPWKCWRSYRIAGLACAVVLLVAAVLWGAEPAEYRTIPAAKSSELTPALDVQPQQYTTWYRSHGDSAGTRYSSLKQINTGNVSQLRVAWVYHSQDGKANIQCNPVIANGVVYGPTAGNQIVAIDGVTGKEKWRFHPEGRPAVRGLEYWPGDRKSAARLFFPAGDWLYALNPENGRPIDLLPSDLPSERQPARPADSVKNATADRP